MKTIKFLSGAMLIILVAGIYVLFYYPLFHLLDMLPNYINETLNTHKWFKLFLIFSPYLFYNLGYCVNDVQRWYKEKMKNLK